MGLALGTAGVVLVVLLWELARPTVMQALAGAAGAWRRRRGVTVSGYDPGRERRAEHRARELLCSCVSEREWAMYRDLGVLQVDGPVRAAAALDSDLRVDAAGDHRGEAPAPAPAAGPAQRVGTAEASAPYAYLIYPHKPIVAYVPATGELLSEYCVAFPDESRPYGSARLPDSDDVLAKWMALTGDERRLIGEANMHLPGRQVDPNRVRRDLVRLARWEHERARRAATPRGPDVLTR